MNKCSNCGKENEMGVVFCTECGTKLNQDDNQQEVINKEQSQINTSNQVAPVKKNLSSGDALGIISLILYFASTGAAIFFAYVLPEGLKYKTFSFLGGMGPLLGVVTMIVGRVKYPDNKLLKIVMWIIIVTIIIGIILFILLVVFCMSLGSYIKGIGA